MKVELGTLAFTAEDFEMAVIDSNCSHVGSGCECVHKLANTILAEKLKGAKLVFSDDLENWSLLALPQSVHTARLVCIEPLRSSDADAKEEIKK